MDINITDLELELVTALGALNRVTEQRDSARNVAVRLEQENARLSLLLAANGIDPEAVL